MKVIGIRKIRKTEIRCFILVALLAYGVIAFQLPKVASYSLTELVPGNHDPIILTGDEAVDQFFAGNGTDGQSWETAYVIRDLQINANQSGSGIELNHTNRYIRIENISCTFSGDWYNEFNGGIRLNSCQNVNITNCIFWDCGFGLFAINCTNLILQDDNFFYCRYGCQLQSISNLVMQRLTIQNTYVALPLWRISSCTFSDLVISNFQYGVGLYYCHNNRFVNLQFLNPPYIGATNILLYDSTGNDFGDYAGQIEYSSFDWARYLPTILIIGSILAAIVIGWGFIIRRREKKMRPVLPPQSQEAHKDYKMA